MTIVAVLKPKSEPVESPKIELKGEKVNDHITEPSEIVPPLSIYEKEKGLPYSAEYFKVKEWEQLQGDMPDLFKKTEKIRTIESWIADKIEHLSLEDSTKSYKNIIDGYFRELDIKPTEKSDSKLDRVYAWVTLLKEQKKLDDKRRKILDNAR
jgi:hypothetical protein